MLICKCVTTVKKERKKQQHTAATTFFSSECGIDFFPYNIVYRSNELDYSGPWSGLGVTLGCPNMVQMCICFVDWIVAYTHRLCLSQWPHESPFIMVQRFHHSWHSAVGPLLEIWSVLIVKHEVCKNRNLNLKITD